MNTDRRSGYYWVLLTTHITEDDILEDWDILFYNRQDDIWKECGNERAVNPHCITEVAPWRLEQDLVNMPVDWKQNAEDAQGILCDAGALFRECHDALNECGRTALAKKVRTFAAQVQECMASGTPWIKDE